MENFQLLTRFAYILRLAFNARNVNEEATNQCMLLLMGPDEAEKAIRCLKIRPRIFYQSEDIS